MEEEKLAGQDQFIPAKLHRYKLSVPEK